MNKKNILERFDAIRLILIGKKVDFQIIYERV